MGGARGVMVIILENRHSEFKFWTKLFVFKKMLTLFGKI